MEQKIGKKNNPMKLIQQPVKTTAVNIAVQETITTWSLVIVRGGKLLWLSRRSDCVFTKVDAFHKENVETP